MYVRLVPPRLWKIARAVIGPVANREPGQSRTRSIRVSSVMPVKNCTHCSTEKTLDQFTNHPRGKFGKDTKCKSCRSALGRERYRKDPQRILKRQTELRRISGYDRRKKYGISKVDYEKLIENQNGLCAICKTKPIFLCVDHDHATNIIRGLLCGRCNKGLGHFGDDVIRLQKAIEYLSQ